MHVKRYPFTLRSLIQFAAYIHKVHPSVPPGRWLSPKQIVTLGHWIERPRTAATKLGMAPAVTTHLIFLRAAGLLDVSAERHWYLTLQFWAWLTQPPEEQLRHLLQTVQQCRYRGMAETMGQTQVARVADLAYFEQQLVHQLHEVEEQALEYAVWEQQEEKRWVLRLPERLPVATRFHLLQMGEWALESQWLTLTPLSIHAATEASYFLTSINHWIGKGVGERLPPAEHLTLVEWYKEGASITIEPVTLLTTRTAEQMGEILRHKRLRRKMTKQISPRHALVRQEMAAPLERWLAKKHLPLNQPQRTKEKKKNNSSAAEYQWLALRLLAEIEQVIPVRVRLPGSVLEECQAAISETKQVEVEATVQEIVGDLKRAIAGRDAFFPAEQPTYPALLTAIQQAIYEEESVQINYKPLGHSEPRRREITPLRLEQRGNLYYLTAYCHLAEDNRTFRLDRMALPEQIPKHPEEPAWPEPLPLFLEIG